MKTYKDIENYSYFLGNDFSEEYFFRDVLVKCYKKKLLDDITLKRIYYERFEILKVQLKYYTKNESSSVTVEVAESLMGGVDYIIGVYLKSFDEFKLIIEELKGKSLSCMLKMGKELINEKIVESKMLLEDIQKNKLKVNNYSYDDTVDYGISLFFKEYEPFFVPHEGLGSIDYQLYIDNMNCKGIEYINNYLKILSLENEFCSLFDICEINELLKGYDMNSEQLLINIFELVLINSLGLIICGKPLDSLNISCEDREYIESKLCKLSIEELQIELLKCADKCCEILNIKNIDLINYIKKSVIKSTDFLNERIKLNKLEKIFISFNKNEGSEVIEYIDGNKLSNSAFKSLSEEIRECPFAYEKIKLIKNNIKSLEDMVDMLKSECLFEGEFIAFYKSLSKMEIILLSRYVSGLGFDTGDEHEWQCEFEKYISSLSEEDKINIGRFKEKIQVI